MAEVAKQADAAHGDMSKSGSWMQRLRAKAEANNIPLHVMLELTNHCNVWCRHCYISDRPPKGELTQDEFQDVLDQLAEAGTLFLTLSGGEALIRPDFFEIAAYARQRDFSLTLFTNGTLITPRMADRLAELCPQRVEISLLGGQAATHDRIMQAPGSFDKALRGARLLVERGVFVQLKTTWMRENIEEAEQIQALVEEIGASAFRSAYMVIHRRDGSAEVANMGATMDQLRVVAQRGYERYGEKGIPPELEPLTEEQQRETSPCGAGQSSGHIDSYGNVYACAAIDTALGNLREETFAAIWSGSEVLKQIRAIRVADLPECSTCRLFMRCSRCAGLAKMETGSLLAASPQACMVAHAFEDFYQEKRCELQ